MLCVWWSWSLFIMTYRQTLNQHKKYSCRNNKLKKKKKTRRLHPNSAGFSHIFPQSSPARPSESSQAQIAKAQRPGGDVGAPVAGPRRSAAWHPTWRPWPLRPVHPADIATGLLAARGRMPVESGEWPHSDYSVLIHTMELWKSLELLN